MTDEKVIKGSQLEKSDEGPVRPKGRILRAAEENFDEGFKCEISGEDYMAKRVVRLTAAEGQKPPKVRGYMATLERDADGKNLKVKVNTVTDTDGMKKFLESDVFKKTLRELDPFATGTDSLTSSTSGFPPNNEYIPLMGGPFTKQLYLYDYLDMHAKCFEAKNHNPLAKQIVDTFTFFSFGKGVQVKFNNPQVQALWDNFEKRNKLQRFLRMDNDTITWAGEVMTQKDFFPDGTPKLVHIDPSTVWEIITAPRDIEQVYYYRQQFPTQWQLVYKPGDISSEYVINDIPADQIFHLKINVVPGEKRGRSDLFAVLGWLKRFKDYYDARIVKAQQEESFGLDVLIKGSAADVEAWLTDPENSKVPRPGDKLVHNEAVEYKYLNVTNSGSGSATEGIGEAIRSIVATGVGLSPEYLGVGGKSSTRATSITKSEPSARKFEDRQTLFRGYLDDIISWWLLVQKGIPTSQVREANLGALKQAMQKRDWIGVAKEASALLTMGNVSEPADLSYQIIFPEIGTEDRTVKLKDIAQTQALQYISRERAANMSASELQIPDYDFDEEQEKIRLELQERETDPLYKADPDPAMALLGKGALSSGPPAAGGQPGAADGSQASDAVYKAGAQQQQ